MTILSINAELPRTNAHFSFQAYGLSTLAINNHVLLSTFVLGNSVKMDKFSIFLMSEFADFCPMFQKFQKLIITVF